MGDAKDHYSQWYGDLRSGQACPIAGRHRVPEIRDQGEQVGCPEPGNGSGHLPEAWITEPQDCTHCHGWFSIPESSILFVAGANRDQPDLLLANLDLELITQIVAQHADMGHVHQQVGVELHFGDSAQATGTLASSNAS